MQDGGKETRGIERSEQVVSGCNEDIRGSLQTEQSLAGKELTGFVGTVNDTSKKVSEDGAYTATIDLTAQSHATIKAVESGSWSQSKRWMSQETKERMVFHKTMQNLHHLAADQSPFIPQTPAELTAFRADMAEIKRKRLSQQVSRRIETLKRKKRPLAADGQGDMVVSLLLGKLRQDDLSPVFASQNCFNGNENPETTKCAPWPSLAELKEDGDRRASRFGRYLPIPRVNVDSVVEDKNGNSFGTRKYMTSIKRRPRFIMPVSPFEDLIIMGEVELHVEEIPAYLRFAIEEMEKEVLA